MPGLTKNLMQLARILVEKVPVVREYLTQTARARPDVRYPLFHLQDALVEHKFQPFPARVMEEPAGDIFREMTMRQWPSKGYLNEKINKLRWPERWSSGDWRVAEEGAQKVDPENMRKYKAALKILKYATQKSAQGLGERKPIMDEALSLLELMPAAAEYPYSGSKRIKEKTDALEQLIKQYKE